MVYMVGPALTTLFEPEGATITAQLTKFTGSGAFKARLSEFLAPLIYRNTPIDTLFNFCILLLIIVFVKNLFRYIQNITTMLLLQSVTNDFRKRMFSKILDLPLAFFHSTKTGELISNVISDVQMMQNSIAVTVVDMVRDPLMMTAYYSFLMIIDWKLTLMLTIVAPIVVGFMSLIGKFLRRYGTRMQEKMAELTSVLQEGILGIRVVKAFGAIKFESDKFNRIADKYLKNLMKMYRVNRLANPFNEGIAVIMAVAIIWFAGKRVLIGTGSSPTEFMQYVVTLLLLMEPIKSFADKFNRVQQGLAAAKRVFGLLDLQPKIPLPNGNIKIVKIKDRIAFKDVSFQYTGTDNYAVSNFSLEIEHGQIVALVGHSGGGKSTIADLLARFYIPTGGSISVDGVDLRDIDKNSWNDFISIVTQEVILFNDTITANIAYGDSSSDMKEISEAARVANAFEFITQTPAKFNTFIGDRGTKLSGGERQRIAIARAIYRNPQLLILDEATSSLDSLSEKLVQQAIDRLVEGRTVLVIAHRLSTIIHAHKIVVLDKGRKICEGVHYELLEKCPRYRELYEMQFENNQIGN